MIFSIKSAIGEEKQVIFNLLQSYLNELSSFPNEQIDYKDNKGIFHYPYLDDYWHKSERHPYILLNDNVIAGFALVRKAVEHWEIAEFYVLPEYRRCGLATFCAIEIFKKHPGKWRIDFNKHNQPSRALWWKLANSLSKDISTGELSASHNYIRFSC